MRPAAKKIILTTIHLDPLMILMLNKDSNFAEVEYPRRIEISSR